MLSIADFRFFDPDARFSVTYGDLPHWEQPGATYFITFRTADSMPRTVVERWRRERDDWLTRQSGIAADLPWHKKLKMLEDERQHQFNRLFRHKFEQQLDRGMGECPFVDAELARIIADSLTHFDGERYHLGDFIVMPNHVHVLVCLFPEFRLLKQCYSWKHYMATEVNKIRGGDGPLWQTESFDHLVREPGQFRKFQRYVGENPVKAGLSDGEFFHYAPEI